MPSTTKHIRVAVTGGGAVLGQGILRAIRRSSLQTTTIVVDPNPLSAGLYWGDESYLVPLANAPEYLASIRSLLAKAKPDVLLIGTDAELGVLAGARESLEREYSTRVLVSSTEVVAIADDKYETAKFLAANELAAPGTALAYDAIGVADLVATYGFPLIVKPRVGARSRGVIRVCNREELNHATQHLPGGIVQECVGEDDQEFTASGLYFDGQCDAAIVMRRDLRDGNTYRAFTMFDNELERQVKAWTNTLKPHGPANFQFRIDRNGVPKTFEINCRFSGTTPLRALAGFNEVEMCIRKVLWGEAIAQPRIEPLTILRHWSETAINPERTNMVSRI